MIRGRKLRLVALAMVLAPLALLASSFLAAPLPAPAPLPDPVPAASPPAGMALFQLPTGVTHRSAAFAYRGGSFRDPRDFTMTAALVQHPRGDLLIDTGFGRNIDAHFREMPFLFRAITSFDRGRSAAEQLEAAGYDRTRLRGILLTHAHWDHVSGVSDFPEVPVLVTSEERRFIEDGGRLTAVARMAAPHYETYAFDGGAYLGFPQSHDLYGDGSIVVVPAPGHTPGSIIAFVALPNGHRYAFVGDLAWQREGITEREERPWLARTFADRDPPRVRENLLRMAAIATRFPDLTLVPAHDARAFAALPTL
ncbi:MBL fold metallo-hydrolase [Pendulispora brunnea]|uniref:MBL fold metallo-hydrolase n=1 Tax=Pendulispora brunnea TaxID=2905690 RepID=A0ABZ2K5Z2_9BACT